MLFRTNAAIFRVLILKKLATSSQATSKEKGDFGDSFWDNALNLIIGNSFYTNIYVAVKSVNKNFCVYREFML